MKSFIIVGVLMLVSICSSLGQNGSFFEKVVKSIELCSESLTPEDAKLIKEDQKPDNGKIRCYKKCVLESIGIFSEGKLNMERVKEIAESVDKELGKGILKTVQNCSEAEALAQKNGNECDVAALYHDCIAKVRVQ